MQTYNNTDDTEVTIRCLNPGDVFQAPSSSYFMLMKKNDHIGCPGDCYPCVSLESGALSFFFHEDYVTLLPNAMMIADKTKPFQP